MQKVEKNKMMSEGEVKNKVEQEKFFFPAEGITVEANSYEEAVEKVKKLSNK